MPTIHYPKASNRYDTRIIRVLDKALTDFEGFAKFNPFHAAHAWIDVKWRGNAYAAYTRYSSNQGVTTYNIHYS
jgi:hypothetical protein